MKGFNYFLRLRRVGKRDRYTRADNAASSRRDTQNDGKNEDCRNLETSQGYKYFIKTIYCTVTFCSDILLLYLVFGCFGLVEIERLTKVFQTDIQFECDPFWRVSSSCVLGCR